MAVAVLYIIYGSSFIKNLELVDLPFSYGTETYLGTVGRLLLPLALACCTAAATDKKLAMAPGDMGELELPLLLWIKEANEVNGLLEPPLLELDSGSRKETETSWSLPTYWTMAELLRASKIDCSCSVKPKKI